MTDRYAARQVQGGRERWGKVGEGGGGQGRDRVEGWGKRRGGKVVDDGRGQIQIVYVVSFHGVGWSGR